MVASYRDKLVSPGGPANRKLTVTRGQHLKQTRHRKNTGSGPEGTFALLDICAQGAHSTGGPVQLWSLSELFLCWLEARNLMFL